MTSENSMLKLSLPLNITILALNRNKDHSWCWVSDVLISGKVYFFKMYFRFSAQHIIYSVPINLTYCWGCGNKYMDFSLLLPPPCSAAAFLYPCHPVL